MFQDRVTERSKNTNMKVNGPNSEGKKKLSGKRADCGTSKKLFRQTQKGREGGKEEHYYLTLYSSWH